MIFLAVLLLLSFEKPDCEMVRAQVAAHGKIAAYTWALANGYTIKEISRIRKVCGI